MYGNYQQLQPMQQNDWPCNQLLLSPAQFNFSQNNYPQVNVSLLLPEMSGLIPIISASIADEICKTAQQNTIRVYTFNQLSYNNFANNDFAQTVQLATDLIALNIRKSNSNVNLHNDVPLMCSNALIIKCSLNAANSQALLSTLTPQIGGNIQQVLNDFKNTTIELDQFKAMQANQARGNTGVFNGGFQGQQNNGFVHPQTAQHFGNFNQQPQIYQPPSNNQQAPRATYGNPAGFSNSSQPNETKREFHAPAFQPIQFVNGVPQASAPAPTLQFSNSPPPPPAPAHSNPTSRFAPIIQEWNSTPPPVPANCPAPVTSFQAAGFRMPEIQNNLVPELQVPIVKQFHDLEMSEIEEGYLVEEVSVNDNEILKWSPSRIQPFPIDYVHTKHKIILKKVSYKGQFFVIQQRILMTEEQMDEFNHMINPATLRDKTMLDVLQKDRLFPVDGLEEGRQVSIHPKIEGTPLNDPIAEADAILNAPPPKELNVQLTPLKYAGLNREPLESTDAAGVPLWADVGFLGDAIHNTRIRHLSSILSKSRIRREYYVVPKVFISKKPLSAFFDNLIEDKTFAGTAKKLNLFMSNVNTSRQHREFVTELDTYLTDLVNEFLRKNLQVVFIDSFAEDIETIMSGYLKNKYGESIHAAMLEFESIFFKRYLTKLSDEQALNNLTEELCISENDPSDSEKIHVLAFETNYSITSIRAHSSELKVPSKITDPTGFIYSITEEQPELLAFCDNLFESSFIKEYQWAKHLILTSDGKIYSVEAPSFGQMKYILREFDTKCMLP